MVKVSVRSRISLGFGLVLAILTLAAVLNHVLVGEIERRVGDFRQAIAEQSLGYRLDLQVAGVRVRVNQWLRSMNPDFSKQADGLLEQLVPMARQVAGDGAPGKTGETVRGLIGSTAAYTASWGVIKQLYADEATIYAQDLAAAGGRIRAGLLAARQAEAERGSVGTVVLLADAQQSLTEAEKLSLLYRGAPSVEAADRVGVALAALRDGVQRSEAATQDPKTAAALRVVAGDAGAWGALFSKATTIARARAERLVSWTRDEGEPMGHFADAIKEEGETRAAAVEAEQFASMERGRSLLYGITAVGLLIGVLSSWLLSRSITRPLGRITGALKTLASGDRSLAIPETGRSDEIGEMARSAQVFKQNAINFERAVVEQEAQKAELAAAQRATMNRTADAFEVKVGSLVSMLSSGATALQATATGMSAIATQTDHRATTVAAAAEEASAGVQTVAAAAEELTASIQEIGRGVAESARVTERAVGDARRTDGIMKTLAEAAQKIGDVVQLITGSRRRPICWR